MEETEIDFAFTMNGEVIAKLVLQSNTFNVGSSQISSQLQAYQSIQIYAVQDSILEKVKNYISKNRADYIMRFYPLNSTDNSLSRGLSLLSPVVQIEKQLDQSSSFSKQAYLFFKMDNFSFPYNQLNISEDICLAKIVNLEEINNGKAMWQC